MSAKTERRIVTATLALSGIVAIGVGALALFTPVAFFASNGIALADSASLLSEVRAAGGTNLAIGVLMFAGSVVRRLRFTSALLVATFYLTYASSRLFGVAMDGLPSEGLVTAAVVELVLGLLGVLVLVRVRRAPRVPQPIAPEPNQIGPPQ